MKRRLFCKGRDQTLWLHCPFIKDAHDESGNNRVVNTINVSFSAEGALTNGNNNSYIDTGYTFDTTSHATTLVFRVKDLSGTSIRNNAFIFGALDPVSNSQDWPNYMWSLLRNDVDEIHIYAYGGKYGVYTSSILRTGFRKVAVVYTKSSSKLYIDDVLRITALGSNHKGCTSLSFGIRHDPNGYSNPCSVQIRNLYIYDRELSLAEIKSINV